MWLPTTICQTSRSVVEVFALADECGFYTEGTRARSYYCIFKVLSHVITSLLFPFAMSFIFLPSNTTHANVILKL